MTYLNIEYASESAMKVMRTDTGETDIVHVNLARRMIQHLVDHCTITENFEALQNGTLTNYAVQIGDES